MTLAAVLFASAGLLVLGLHSARQETNLLPFAHTEFQTLSPELFADRLHEAHAHGICSTYNDLYH